MSSGLACLKRQRPLWLTLGADPPHLTRAKPQPPHPHQQTIVQVVWIICKTTKYCPAADSVEIKSQSEAYDLCANILVHHQKHMTSTSMTCVRARMILHALGFNLSASYQTSTHLFWLSYFGQCKTKEKSSSRINLQSFGRFINRVTNLEGCPKNNPQKALNCKGGQF